MFQQIIDIQRDIYMTFAGHIKEFAAGGGWASFLAFLPMGIVFGAVHAMTPGHSKSVLATYLAGSSMKAHRALLVSLALSFTHVTTAVLIALLALPLGHIPSSTPDRLQSLRSSAAACSASSACGCCSLPSSMRTFTPKAKGC
jgi:ABC-type nickel/cobalt efflux system permease component RcnA